jgi:hypothetical protein
MVLSRPLRHPPLLLRPLLQLHHHIGLLEPDHRPLLLFWTLHWIRWSQSIVASEHRPRPHQMLKMYDFNTAHLSRFENLHIMIFPFFSECRTSMEVN